MTATTAPERLEPLGSRPPDLELTGAASPPGTLLAELWRSWALIVILARREFHTRYRRASFGILWALVLPLVQSLVLAAVLGKFIKVQHGIDYPAFVLTGIVAWSFFAAALGAGSTAIVDNVTLASRVYFPRAVLPIVQVLQNLYAFSVTIVIVLALLPAFGVGFGLHDLLIVPGAVASMLLALGFALILSALHVFFRDIRYIVSAGITIWFYATPIIYSSSAPQVRRIHFLLTANPASGVVDLFRAATVGSTPLLVPVAVLAVWIVGLLTAGLLLQSRLNRAFTDLL